MRFSRLSALLALFLSSAFDAHAELRPKSLCSERNQMPYAVEQVIPATVFIAKASCPFDEYFEFCTDGYIESLRSVYEYFWPPTISSGSGFIISPEGHVVTNAHVVEGATYLYVALTDCDERVLKAEVLGVDHRTDLAVLKIEKPDEDYVFPYLTFGDSDAMKIGERIAVIGTPIDSIFESSVTMGVISGRGRILPEFPLIGESLQTDAAINGGNSGSPAINSRGEVIGVVFGGCSPEYDGVGFLIPSQIAQKVVPQLIDYGKALPGYFGVDIRSDQQWVFDAYCVTQNQGAVVYSVALGSPAEEAGIEAGDRIVEINGHPIGPAVVLIDQLAISPPGELVVFRVIRDGKELEITAVLRSYELS